MNPARQLASLGQSLWLDNITRDIIDQGTLHDYRERLCVSGLTSNPSIFEKAITGSGAYEASIREGVARGRHGENLFFDLAIEDLRRAADEFRPIHERTHGVDGWVSLEVSPLLARDSARTVAAARALHAQAARPNLFIKIPGNDAGIPAIEEAIFAGIPINVTLLFSRAQYLAAAEAYLRGIERRIEAGLDPHVDSVASVFISRWDVAVADSVPAELKNRLGIAVAGETYESFLQLQVTPRWQRIFNFGARPQRLLWASTGTKDPAASDVLYVEALAAPFTINTIPGKTLEALADHGRIGRGMPADGGDSRQLLAHFTSAGVDVTALATRLQDDGATAFVKSWHHLLGVIKARATATG